MAVKKQELLDLYRTMVRIRTFEETAHKEFLKGDDARLPPPLQWGRSDRSGRDVGASTRRLPEHQPRGHGHLIAKGGDTKRMFAELFGKVDGFCKGKGGSMHIADISMGVLGANGIVGACVHIGTGAAFACKYKKNGRIAVAFFGDASTNRGTFHEALNLASIWDLPIVYVVENNLYGVANCQRDYMKIQDVADRAASYGFPGVIVDGNDVVAVREAAAEAVTGRGAAEAPPWSSARPGGTGATSSGDAATYRDPGRARGLAQARPADSLAAEVLRSRKWATEADLEKIQAEADAEMQAALEFGKNSPFPSSDELYTDVYTNWKGGRTWA